MTTNSAIERSGATVALALTEALVMGREDERVRVRLAPGGAFGERTERLARVAVPGYAPAEGDRVLVQQIAETGALYVTGVVRARGAPSAQRDAQAEPPSAALTAPSGASATVDGDLLSLRDAAGRVVATLDGQSGELRIAAEGDLRLCAPSGRVLVEAAGEVALSGASLRVNAAEALFAVGHWELRAQRIIERATDALRTVDALLETRAKHARTLVSRTLELVGRRTTIVSQEDTRIDGKRVLLG